MADRSTILSADAEENSRLKNMLERYRHRLMNFV